MLRAARLTVWTDGGSNSRGSGWAVVCPAKKEIYRGELRDENGKIVTNQKAELSAIIQAVHIYGPNIKIISDSDYGIKCFTQWYQNWMKNGWRTAKGPVVNRPLIELGLSMKVNQAEFEHVYRDGGDPHNIMADYYTKTGELQPQHEKEGWTIYSS